MFATFRTTAIAAGAYHSLALKQDGSVIAWGCKDPTHFGINVGQCRIPTSAKHRVSAISAGAFHNLVLKSGQ